MTEKRRGHSFSTNLRRTQTYPDSSASTQAQQHITDAQKDKRHWHPTLLPTRVLSTTATETLRSAESTQTWFPNATYYFFLWFSEHHRLMNHTFDWDSAQCLTYSTNDFQRLTLHSWFTKLEQTPLNKCQPLPAPYKRLSHDINIINEVKRKT